MESQPRELNIYETDDGDAPFSSWLDSLRDREARARIKKQLDRVALGNLGDYRSVGEGVFEFRIDYGSGYRIYFAQVETLILLLLWDGDKSTQERDIPKAKQFWADFKQRENANERSYHSYLVESLKDPQEAAAYLDAVLEDGSSEEVRLALKNVVEAQIAGLENSQLVSSRREIHQALSQQSQLDFSTLIKILSDLGFRISIAPREDAA